MSSPRLLPFAIGGDIDAGGLVEATYLDSGGRGRVVVSSRTGLMSIVDRGGGPDLRRQFRAFLAYFLVKDGVRAGTGSGSGSQGQQGEEGEGKDGGKHEELVARFLDLIETLDQDGGASMADDVHMERVSDHVEWLLDLAERRAREGSASALVALWMASICEHPPRLFFLSTLGTQNQNQRDAPAVRHFSVVCKWGPKTAIFREKLKGKLTECLPWTTIYLSMLRSNKARALGNAHRRRRRGRGVDADTDTCVGAMVDILFRMAWAVHLRCLADIYRLLGELPRALLEPMPGLCERFGCPEQADRLKRCIDTIEVRSYRIVQVVAKVVEVGTRSLAGLLRAIQRERTGKDHDYTCNPGAWVREVSDVVRSFVRRGRDQIIADAPTRMRLEGLCPGFFTCSFFVKRAGAVVLSARRNGLQKAIGSSIRKAERYDNCAAQTAMSQGSEAHFVRVGADCWCIARCRPPAPHVVLGPLVLQGQRNLDPQRLLRTVRPRGRAAAAQEEPILDLVVYEETRIFAATPGGFLELEVDVNGGVCLVQHWETQLFDMEEEEDLRVELRVVLSAAGRVNFFLLNRCATAPTVVRLFREGGADRGDSLLTLDLEVEMEDDEDGRAALRVTPTHLFVNHNVIAYDERPIETRVVPHGADVVAVHDDKWLLRRRGTGITAEYLRVDARDPARVRSAHRIYGAHDQAVYVQGKDSFLVVSRGAYTAKQGGSLFHWIP